MKKSLLGFLASIMVLFTMVGCGCLCKANKPETENIGTSMMSSFVMEATRWQVDSICKADALPQMDGWIKTSFRDFETGRSVTKYMYIQEVGENESIYIIMGDSEPYIVTKRITR